MLLDTEILPDERLDREDVRAIAMPLAGLSERDLAVIRLSRKERLGTVLPASKASRWLSILFGISHSGPLADSRLESLRRYCVLARHRHPDEDDAWTLLLQSGFADPQRYLIDALIA